MRRAVALHIFLSITIGLPCAAFVAAQTSNAPAVTLSPGNDIQAAVNAAPAGTTFVLLAGLYRMQSVQPKSGDIFNGQGSVDLNGSQVLSFQPDPAAVGLWVANAKANDSAPGSCVAAHPLCKYIQDLFVDNVLQVPAANTQGMKPGAWYFDRAHGNVYLAINPAGHTVELGMQEYAFYGNATGVQLNNLIVEKYATPAQTGAVGGPVVRSANGWVVNKVEARWNHGRGISLGGSNSQILNSFIHHNGQLGISLYGANCSAINNEISWNNYAGFNPGWEAGGSKFWATTNLQVKSNYVHDNIGAGLWTDNNNVGTLYDSNTVINNLGPGITHEISYNAIIRNNTVKGNGNTSTVWLWNSQIGVQNSSNVEVYGNIVEVPAAGGNGIGIINQNRGTGTQGPWVAANNYVHNNTITYLGTHGETGYVNDTGGSLSAGNRFNFNHYIVKSGGTGHWTWNPVLNWSQFLAMGQETNGKCCN
jgi:hypothetical protein